MRPKTRNSLPAKVAALGFTVVILMGNFLLVYILTGKDLPIWMVNIFQGGVAVAFAGVFGLLIRWFLSLFWPDGDDVHVDEEGGVP